MYAGYYPMGLSLDRTFAELPNVPFRGHVSPLFLPDNAMRFATHSVTLLAVDHGEEVLPVRCWTTQVSDLGVHAEEPGRSWVDVERYLRSQGRRAGKDSETLE